MTTPLRCTACGMIINKKPGAKTPKYCPPCRHETQQVYKKKVRR